MKVKIKIVDTWFDDIDKSPVFSYLIRILQQRFDLVFSEDPEFLLCSCFGTKALQYDCCKIFFTGENIIPDFNIYDYAMGFYWLQFGQRYLRIPLYALYERDYKRALKKHEYVRQEGSEQKYLQRKFCNFVVSNSKSADPIREVVFRELSNYRIVDSGGRYLNNIGGPVKDKLDFQRQYKFSLVFENSSVEGYTTEKIIQAWGADSVPIYWGNKKIDKEFNEKSFINCNGKSLEEIVNEVIELDRNDDKYMDMLREPIVRNDTMPNIYSEEYILDFFEHIFVKGDRFVNNLAGRQQGYYRRMQRYSKIENNLLVENMRKIRRRLNNI